MKENTQWMGHIENGHTKTHRRSSTFYTYWLIECAHSYTHAPISIPIALDFVWVRFCVCACACACVCVCVFLCYFFLALISWVLRGVVINSCFIFISLLIDHTLINECKRFSLHLFISLLNTRLSIIHTLAPSATLIHPFALAPLNYEHSSFYKFLLDSCCCAYSACGIVCVSYAIYVYVCVHEKKSMFTHKLPHMHTAKQHRLFLCTAWNYQYK